MAGSDPIGPAFGPAKSLRASGVAPVHGLPSVEGVTVVFAASSMTNTWYETCTKGWYGILTKFWYETSTVRRS